MGNTLRNLIDRLWLVNPIVYLTTGTVLVTLAAGTAVALTDTPVRQFVADLPAHILGIIG